MTRHNCNLPKSPQNEIILHMTLRPGRSGRDVSLQLSSFGVVAGQCPYVSSDFPRWREVAVFAN